MCDTLLMHVYDGAGSASCRWCACAQTPYLVGSRRHDDYFFPSRMAMLHCIASHVMAGLADKWSEFKEDEGSSKVDVTRAYTQTQSYPDAQRATMGLHAKAGLLSLTSAYNSSISFWRHNCFALLF